MTAPSPADKHCFALLLCLLLSGCSWSIDEWLVDQAIKACESKGGIHEISTVKTIVTCRDGAWVYLRRPTS